MASPLSDQEVRAAIARNLYWGYMKDTTGTTGKWSELDEGGRKIWRAMAKRALRKINELMPPNRQGAHTEE